jgi:hypothetical protein
MSNIELITEAKATALFDELLDDSQEAISIGFGTFYPSDILRQLDPIAYRLGLNEYIDSLFDDGIFVEGYTEEDYQNRLAEEQDEEDLAEDYSPEEED